MPGGGVNVGALLVFVCVSVAIGTLVGAILLRAAIGLYNKLFGGKRRSTRVPEPPLPTAILITFVTSVVNVGVAFVIGFATGIGAAATGVGGKGASLVAQSIALPISVLVMAGLLAAMLPTSIGRAMVVVALQAAIALAIGAFVMVGMIALTIATR